MNTIGVGANVAPTVIKTYTSHYLNRKKRREKPTAHISYDEGLNLVRQFLYYASLHTVEDIQAFTSQWVPTPRWVRTEQVAIPETKISEARNAIVEQLGPEGVDRVGGKAWWQWRREGSPLQADWIEMRHDYHERKRSGEPCRRVILYVHGGAYFFGSVDEHRYQMQRHARKLKARVFAPRYRLAPQFPFPCGLVDCLAAYLHLLTVQDPSTIVVAGDSAGGGMVLSLLVILRDRGLPLPAGAILISPWVDLAHSFPSIMGDTQYDYIPAHGFMHKPSAAWPPPSADDGKDVATQAIESAAEADSARQSTPQERGPSSDTGQAFPGPDANREGPVKINGAGIPPSDGIPRPGYQLSVVIDEKLVEIEEQIHMYTTNQLISHPLVSPVLQPSLGGLPPMLIMVGGGEILRDEQIYLAHKAANPSKYSPGEVHLGDDVEARNAVSKWKPTDVQLQVWDDLCHVAPTLSFTRPAKFMYRSIAQFGAWALARAQGTDVDILDDDEISVISSDESSEDGKPRQGETAMHDGEEAHGRTFLNTQVGKAGDSLPPFREHMIRQRVDRHGNIFPLAEPSSLPALQMPADEIGVIKPGPVEKWMEARRKWDSKFAREKRKVQRLRAKEMAEGFQGFGNDEVPPPSALAGRRGMSEAKEKKQKKSYGLSLWSLWGSSHDEKAVGREGKLEKSPLTSTATPEQGKNVQECPARPVPRNGNTAGAENEAEADPPQPQPADDGSQPSPKFVPVSSPCGTSLAMPQEGAKLVLDGTNVTLDSRTAKRPKADGIAFPFKLGRHLMPEDANASTVTLTSYMGAPTPHIPDDACDRTTDTGTEKEAGR